MNARLLYGRLLNSTLALLQVIIEHLFDHHVSVKHRRLTHVQLRPGISCNQRFLHRVIRAQQLEFRNRQIGLNVAAVVEVQLSFGDDVRTWTLGKRLGQQRKSIVRLTQVKFEMVIGKLQVPLS